MTAVLTGPAWLIRQIRLQDIAGALAFGLAVIFGLSAITRFDGSAGYAWAFVAVAVAEGAFAARLMFSSLPGKPYFTLAGAGSNLLLAGLGALYMAGRLPGIGEAQAATGIGGLAGALAVAMQLGLAGFLSAIYVKASGSPEATRSRMLTAALLASGMLSITGLAWGVGEVQARLDARVSAAAAQSQGAAVASGALPTYAQLYPLLARSGDGPNRTSIEAFYAPPVYFQVAGVPAPEESLGQPTLLVVVQESDHEHLTGLLPKGAPEASLTIDNYPAVEPYNVSVLYEASDHRTTQLLFPYPAGLTEATLFESDHFISTTVTQNAAFKSVFSWQVPLVTDASVSATEAVPFDQFQLTDLTKRLTRTVEGAEYGGVSNIRVEGIYATPAYFSAALPASVTSAFRPDLFANFVVVERLHSADLPGIAPEVSLKVDGTTYEPALSQVITSSPHHRATLVKFATEPAMGLRHRQMDLRLAGNDPMVWHFPINLGSGQSTAGSTAGVSGVWLLAILGGLIAAMWPCLFQLTVFFIPALAGISMHDASSGNVSVVKRAAVVKAAFFFVLGFTVVYTVAGAVIGYLAGRMSDMSSFYQWQRYLGIAGGIVILVLAVRVAAQVRAPLVCKMPIVSGMGKRKGPATPVQMMIAGVAFATGCMTCFGAAVVVAMVVYVGLSGSAFVGAFTLFLFALGMGVPLVLASTLMAKAMPLLNRFEKAVRWMGLASTLVMVGSAILLITGNYMLLTEWIYKTLPGSGF